MDVDTAIQGETTEMNFFNNLFSGLFGLSQGGTRTIAIKYVILVNSILNHQGDAQDSGSGSEKYERPNCQQDIRDGAPESNDTVLTTRTTDGSATVVATSNLLLQDESGAGTGIFMHSNGSSNRLSLPN
jgi:hypothetical protein